MTTVASSYVKNRVRQKLYTRDNPPTVHTVDKSAYTVDMVLSEEFGKSMPSRGEVLQASMPSGFVKDMVLATRGVESPTMFCMWAGLFITGCALQRRAHIWPEPHQLYPNVFLVFMAPPAVNKKSTTVNMGTKVLKLLPELFDDEVDKEIFTLPIHDGAVTPEGMFDLLVPRTVQVYEDGLTEPLDLHLGSRLALIVDELSSFLGKQKYNGGQISRMINLYDCKDSDSNYTKKDKMKRMENVFFSFFAATTPSGFQESIPEEAHGGGFVSRLSFVFEPDPIRFFPKPVRIEGAPTIAELSQKLAWIARFKGGEYTLSPEANEMYEKWYMDYRESFSKGGLNYNDEGNSRSDVMVMKIAMLIRAQAYDLSTEINEDEMSLALLIVDEMEKDKTKAYALGGGTEWSNRVKVISDLIKSKPRGMVRSKLVGEMLNVCNMAQMDEALFMLTSSGKVTIELEGETIGVTRKRNDERYFWNES